MEGDGAGFEDDGSALGHGVAGVDDEVHDGAVELGWVDHGASAVVAEEDLEFEALAEDSVEEGAEGAEELVGADAFGAEGGASGVGQELAGELGASDGGVEGWGEDVLELVAGIEDVLGFFEVEDDDGEEVVEVVSDSAGELAEGAEGFVAEEDLFGAFVVGDVLAVSEEFDDVAGFVEDGADFGAEVSDLVVWEVDAVFEVLAGGDAGRGDEGGADGAAVVGVDGLDEGVGSDGVVVAGETHEFEHFAGPADALAVDGHAPGAEAGEALGFGEFFGSGVELEGSLAEHFVGVVHVAACGFEVGDVPEDGEGCVLSGVEGVVDEGSDFEDCSVVAGVGCGCAAGLSGGHGLGGDVGSV